MICLNNLHCSYYSSYKVLAINLIRHYIKTISDTINIVSFLGIKIPHIRLEIYGIV